ncbi:MAG: hypothetical protein LAT50_21415 [Ectothiorhodospiraceae bacterium]|nr:hypothetical protein [Ectothiorhodospiraceae bacterium]
MASEKPARILRAKSDLTAEQIDGLTDKEAWRLMDLCPQGRVRVVQGVSKTLAILVVGPEPGPEKVRKAEEVGAEIMGEDQFAAFLETGVVGGAPGPADA